MKFTRNIVAASNDLRGRVQRAPDLPTIDHGESVAILLWWGFLLDHSSHQGIPVEQLARQQLEAFIPWARTNFFMVRPGEH